jgi:NTE family protein
MRVGLVLSGGGSRGAFEAGVVAAMEDAGLSLEVVSGTSAGAVNAAGLAAGFSADRLAALWTSLSDTDVYRQRRDVWNLLRPPGLLSGGSWSERLLRSIGWTWLWDWRPLHRTLTDIFGGERIPVTGAVPLVVSSVQVTTGELIRFASSGPPRERDDLVVTAPTVDHLIASAAVPLLFRPGRVAQTAYWDGGIVANTPLAPALSWRPDAVVVVTTTTLRRPAPEPSSLAESISLLIDTAQRFALDADLAMAEEVNRRCRVDPGVTDRREVDVLLIDPRGEDLGDGMSFDPDQARRLFALGRQIGADALDGWRFAGRID